MTPQLSVQALLSAKLAEVQGRNPQFSLRALARKLGVGASTVSMVIAGKRPVSAKLAERICDALMLDPEERYAVITQFSPKRASLKKRVPTPAYVQLSADQFRFMSEWHYFGILSLLKTRGFKSDSTWIATRLGVTRDEVQVALATMKRLGVLVEENKGQLKRVAQQVSTTDGVADVSVRKSHFQGLELARRSLDEDEVEERDFTYLNFPMHPSLVPELKRMIRDFQDEVDHRLEQLDPSPTEVYRLAVSLYPLTRPERKKRKTVGNKK